jgi:hypothetical protein
MKQQNRQRQMAKHAASAILKRPLTVDLTGTKECDEQVAPVGSVRFWGCGGVRGRRSLAGGVGLETMMRGDDALRQLAEALNTTDESSGWLDRGNP